MSAAPDTHLRLVAGGQEPARIPPHNVDAEAAVLSAVMLAPPLMSRLVDWLRPEHFFSRAHHRIFDAARALHAAGTPCDIIGIGELLRSRGQIDGVGGMKYLTEIVDCTPAIDNVADHAAIVFDKWRLRRIVALSQRAEARGYRGVESTQEFADQVTKALAEVARSYPNAKVETNVDVLRRLVKAIATASEAAKDGAVRGVPTGIRAFDEATLGLHAGQKVTVVALPRVGKTAFGLQVALHVAKTLNVAVLFFSTEMSKDELAERQVANLARVDGRKLREAKLGKSLAAADWSRVVAAVSERVHLFVDDTSDLTIEDVCTRTRAFAETSMAVHKVPLGLVVVDYVQNLASSRAVSDPKKHAHVAHATTAFKTLCKDLGIPGIELAQQKNLDIERKTGKRARPHLGCAADSSVIERSSDVVLYLHRASEDDGGRVTGLIVKQRSGEESEFPLTFRREWSRFEEGERPGMVPSSRQWVDGAYPERFPE